jgi:hypothetical protein
MFRISDIRIGVKLAVVSGLGVALVAGTLFVSLCSYKKVTTTNDAALLQQNIVRDLDRLKHQANAMKERVAAFGVDDAEMASSADGEYGVARGMRVAAAVKLNRAAAAAAKRVVSAGGGDVRAQEF